MPILREGLFASCDRGRQPAELQIDFPNLDFRGLPNNWWTLDDENDKETPQVALEKRVNAFRTVLARANHRARAVIGHGQFLLTLTGRSFDNCEFSEFD